MSMGPLEYLVVAFPGSRFKGDIIPALKRVVDNGTIRVIDLVFVRKDASGNVTEVELEDLDLQEEADGFSSVVGEISGLFAEDDIFQVAESLDNGSSAALLLVEHLWATEFRDAVVAAGGVLVASERIPKETVDRALAWQPGDSA
jgi:hypothetical protein